MAEKTFVCHRTQAAGQEEFNSRLNYHLLYKVRGRVDVGGAS